MAETTTYRGGRENGKKLYGLLLRLSPDVPIPSAELAGAIYLEDAAAAGISSAARVKRLYGLVNHGRRVGWRIRSTGYGKAGGLVIDRRDYRWLREAFGYRPSLGGCLVDWRRVVLKPAELRAAVRAARKAEALRKALREAEGRGAGKA